MARHDREDPHSLEEQLAWLDSIKENEEVPAAVSASVDDAAGASPYPKDPWLAVASEAGSTPPPPMFRAASDSVYGSSATTGEADNSDTIKIDGSPFPADPATPAKPDTEEAPKPEQKPEPTATAKPEPTATTAPSPSPSPFSPTPPADTSTPPPPVSALSPSAKSPATQQETATDPPPGPRPAFPADTSSPTGPVTPPSDLFLADSLLKPFPKPDFDDAFARGPFGEPGMREPDGGDLRTGESVARESAVKESTTHKPDGDDRSSEDTGAISSFGPFPAARQGSIGAFDNLLPRPRLEQPEPEPSQDAHKEPVRGWLEPAVQPLSSSPPEKEDPAGDSEQERFAAFMAGGDLPDRDATVRVERKPRTQDPMPSAESTPRPPQPPTPSPRRPDPLTDPDIFRTGTSTTSPPFGSDPGRYEPEPLSTPPSFGSESSSDRDKQESPASSPFGASPLVDIDRHTPDSSSAPVSFAATSLSDRYEPESPSAPPTSGTEPSSDPSPYAPESLASPTTYDPGASQEPKPYTPEHTADASSHAAERPTEQKPRTPRAEPEPPDHHTTPRAQHSRRRNVPPPAFSVSPRPPISSKPTADSLDPLTLLKTRRNAPSKGWRRLVYKASAGWIKPGEPPEVRRRRELLSRARTPVAAGHHRVAVLSLKGGVGKTTTTVGLGATLGQIRGDRVIAVDANPDRGTLSDKVVLETSATVRDLLNERKQIQRYVDIRAFTSQAPSRLEILASDRDPSISEAFSASDYQAIAQILENFYSICITDCGTGLLHSAMSGVLGLADQLVLVSSPSVDGARAASATLDWLEAHRYGDLVEAASVVLCSVRPRSKSNVDLDRLEAHFVARCRAVIRVPYDPHLEEGAEIELERLQPATRDAYLQLAAAVGDGFAGPHP